jgi:hypothetical protein
MNIDKKDGNKNWMYRMELSRMVWNFLSKKSKKFRMAKILFTNF